MVVFYCIFVFVSFIYTLSLAIRGEKAFGFLEILNHSVLRPEMKWKQRLLAHLKKPCHLKCFLSTTFHHKALLHKYGFINYIS